MTYEKLLQYALRIISKKRYTCFEMRRKLERFLKKANSEKKENENDKLSNNELADKEALEDDYAVMEDDALIVDVLARLEELKYLDDGQYARDYITTRLKLRPRGQFLLSRELKLKGINSEVAAEILNEQNINEAEIAKNALEKRMRQWEKLPDQKGREKAFRFLSARGFAQDAIYKAIKSCYHAGTEQNLD